MTNRHTIARADIMTMDAYAAVRQERREAVTAIKRHRRLEVGPACTFYFESYATLWHQVHEMLHIERGGEAQIADELAAYNPMVPNGRELVATVMFEIDDPVRRAALLGRLGGVECTACIRLADDIVHGVPEDEVERTNAAGKTSAIHFIHFPFTAAQIEAFRVPGARVTLGLEHQNYGHASTMPEVVRLALADDFDRA